MIKTYEARAKISINISINGGYKHISFMPLSNGKSVYYSKNKEECEAIEKHHRFNDLFTLVSVKEDKVETKKEEIETPKKAEIKVVKVRDVSEAKDYLAETFGISRSSLRSTNAIKEQADAYGVEFEGI